jgi:hypothetical protein
LVETGKDSPVNAKLLYAGGERVGEYVDELTLIFGRKLTLFPATASRTETSLLAVQPTLTVETRCGRAPYQVSSLSSLRIVLY